MMDAKGDIPDKEAIRPPSSAAVSPTGHAKVALVDTLLDDGGVIHVYLESITNGSDGSEDIHLHDFNTYRFDDTGWIYYHADDKDVWIAGDDIGTVERHYQE